MNFLCITLTLLATQLFACFTPRFYPFLYAVISTYRVICRPLGNNPFYKLLFCVFVLFVVACAILLLFLAFSRFVIALYTLLFATCFVVVIFFVFFLLSNSIHFGLSRQKAQSQILLYLRFGIPMCSTSYLFYVFLLPVCSLSLRLLTLMTHHGISTMPQFYNFCI